MELPAISVIIPLYNAERYVADCLNSLLAQTFQNFEVIIVDDCSTDSSCAVVESFIERFNGRLTLTHMETNSGSAGLPRNKGLMFSRGEYIYFVDADDLLTKTALEEMYTLARKFDAEVVYFTTHYDADESIKTLKPSSGYPTVNAPTLESENLTERIQSMARNKYRLETCAKFTRRKLLVENKIFFPQVKSGEDELWTFGLLIYAKRFLIVPNIVYIYRQGIGSIMRKNRTPLQFINFWINTPVLGLKYLDEMTARHEFFKANPQYRYAIPEIIIKRKFNEILSASLQVPPSAIYDAIKQKYSDKLGEYDVLIPALATALNTQQKIFFADQQKYRQFATQAQAHIAQLEAELKRLQT